MGCILGSYILFRENSKYIPMDVGLVCFSSVNVQSLFLISRTNPTSKIMYCTAPYLDCFHQAHRYFFHLSSLSDLTIFSPDQDICDIRRYASSNLNKLQSCTLIICLGGAVALRRLPFHYEDGGEFLGTSFRGTYIFFTNRSGCRRTLL